MIVEFLTVNAALVLASSLATSDCGPDGEWTVNLPVNAPADVDVIVAGVVVTAVPLNVNVNAVLGAKLVPVNVTWVPLDPDVGESVILETTLNGVVGLFVPSDAVMV